ncbi:hypothetical protein PFISCL1PPCAC_22105 [Pristionchus fissidentatus]|uniref:Uncharacterized protein n=1 Tax=Pristionchus fissidentatus TaxID=1538716 RepID=A0AAV5WKI0_9BILA|nr:hypothetical protein PFISCL1PPCAC_22105 [Pristionchus fissidentatus]
MAVFEQIFSLVAGNRPEGFFSEMEDTADQIVRSFDQGYNILGRCFYKRASDSFLFNSSHRASNSQLKMAVFEQIFSLVAGNRPEGFYSEMEETADQIVKSFDHVCV